MKSRNRNRYEKFGNLFFITSTVVGHIEIFKANIYCDIFIDNLRFYQSRGDFTVLAYVLMPDHFHLILKTNSEYSISQCIGNFKRITSRQITARMTAMGATQLLNDLSKKAILEPAKDTRLWKPRFDCFVLTKVDTLRQKIDYIHNNPVKRGLVNEATDWLYSSARSYACMGDVVLSIDSEWRCLN